MLRARANGETFVSATMCPRLPVPLDPFLFNVYINSLSTAVTRRELILHADDAVLMVAASTPQELNGSLRYDFNLISSWYIDNKLTLNDYTDAVR